MKLILVIALGLLAVSVNAKDLTDSSVPTGKIFDEIRNIVESGVDYGKKILDKVYSLENEILEEAKDSTDLSVKNTLKNIVEAIKKIKDYANIGAAGKICVEKHSQQLEDIMTKVNDNIEECQNILKKDLIPVEREIWQTYMLMFKHISEMYEVIEQCMNDNENNKIGLTMCVVKKVKFFKDQITSAHEILKASIQRLKELVPKALEDFGNCILEAELNGVKQLPAITSSVAKCVKENV